ncbi:MAG: hypothetical protein HON65_09555 [Rhodospirillales bacterium]|nr:hypothetical protein [Rhodospirillales bacterium]
MARGFVYIAFVAGLVADVLVFGRNFYGIKLKEAIYSIPNVLDLNIFAFGPYVAMSILLLVLAVVVPIISSKTGQIGNRERIHVCSGIFLLAAIDLSANGVSSYWFKGTTAGGADWEASNSSKPESALGASGISPEFSIANGHKMLIVVVEALGQFKDESLNQAVFSVLESPVIAEKFQLVRGSIPYSGATTAAEMRELCASEYSFLNVLDKSFDTSECLPQKLARMGVTSVSYHGLTSAIFDRKHWYPSIGFTKNIFYHQLIAEPDQAHDRFCSGAFVGYCDRLIGEKIQAALSANAQHGLYYWLTLNSHFPAERTQQYGKPFPCAKYELSEQLCIMTEYWTEVLDSVAKIAESADTGPLDILIVGDHAPPLIYRKSRDLLARNRVPYAALRWRGSQD